MNILLIEDERQLSEVLTTILKQNQYAVDAVYDGLSGEEYALSGIYDAIILDIMLPGKNGLDILDSLRSRGISIPVLLLTAKSDIDDKVKGLDQGADDYLTKPFATRELLARLRAMTRRKGAFTGDILTHAETTLNKNTHELQYEGNCVKLGMKEYRIMELLMQNPKQVIPRERFFEKVWGFESEAEYNAIEVYISFLRKKLALIRSPLQVKAMRGVGYALEEAGDA